MITSPKEKKEKKKMNRHVITFTVDATTHVLSSSCDVEPLVTVNVIGCSESHGGGRSS